MTGRAVVELRARGLSVTKIANRLGLGRSTVERDLDAVPHEPPAYVVGVDGKTPAKPPKRPALTIGQ